MTIQEKVEFWQSSDPRELKSLGDRLLAESLPHVSPSRSREEVAVEIHKVRQHLGWSPLQVSRTLGVTEELFVAWEEDRVRAPECLPHVLKRLAELSAEPLTPEGAALDV